MSVITPDFGLIVWMTLIFLIVFFILARWGFPMITKSVDERAQRINSSILKAREAEKSLEGVLAQQEAIIEKAKEEQRRILSDAKLAGEQIVESSRHRATELSQEIIAQARTQIDREKEEAVRQIRESVAEVSVQVAEKILRERLPGASAEKFLDKISEEIKL